MSIEINPIIIYEDKELMVINKPAGMTVNRSSTMKSKTLQDWVEEKLPMPSGKTEEDQIYRERSGIAHRLDKETSGVMLIAKSAPVLRNLMEMFKKRLIKKEYLALVHGKVEPKEGTVRLPLGRGKRDRRKWRVVAEGKVAETAWKVRDYFLAPSRSLGAERLSLISLFPLTGRTHQIRVHMAHLNHPLVADEKYLNPKKKAEDRKLIQRHFLHALSLELTDSGGKKLKFRAPLPAELNNLVKSLKKVDVAV